MGQPGRTPLWKTASFASPECMDFWADDGRAHARRFSARWWKRRCMLVRWGPSEQNGPCHLWSFAPTRHSDTNQLVSRLHTKHGKAHATAKPRLYSPPSAGRNVCNSTLVAEGLTRRAKRRQGGLHRTTNVGPDSGPKRGPENGTNTKYTHCGCIWCLARFLARNPGPENGPTNPEFPHSRRGSTIRESEAAGYSHKVPHKVPRLSHKL